MGWSSRGISKGKNFLANGTLLSSDSIEFIGEGIGLQVDTTDPSSNVITLRSTNKPYELGNIQVTYERDANGRISKETMTGDVNRVTTFTYGMVTATLSKIVTQEIIEDGKKITDQFQYNASGEIIGFTRTTGEATVV